MNYDEAIKFLFDSVPNYQKSGKTAIRKGLKNIKILSNHFNNPHNTFNSIHVGGTNGKGTTSVAIANFCLSLDLKIGLFTSPHVYDFRERIQVNGKNIEKSFLINFVSNNKDFFKENDFSFFEINTVMAFEYFRYCKVDLAVIEVGLGGKLDSTNIIKPIISLVTNVGYDHQNILGDKIEHISREKAGIIKPNSLFIKGEEQNNIDHIFKDECKKTNSNFLSVSRNIKVKSLSKTFSKRKIRIEYNKNKTFELNLENPANYYLMNIKAAIFAFIKTAEYYKKAPLLSKHNKNKFKVYGRWNIISKNPYIISDGCHNIDSFKSIISEIHTSSFKNIYFITGGVKEKKWNEICEILPKEYNYILIQPSNKRAINTSDLKRYFIENKLNYNIKIDINDALKYCKKIASKNDLIFIGGSLFLMSDYNEE